MSDAEKLIFCSRCGTQLPGDDCNFCPNCGAPSLLDTGGRVKAIGTAIRYLVRLSVCQIVSGVICIIMGILTLSFALPAGGWPLVSASPVWTGLVVTLAGLCGFLTRYTKKKSVHNKKLKSLVLSHFILSNLSITVCAFHVAFTGWTLGVCAGWTDVQCFPNIIQNLSMGGINLVVGVVSAIFSIIGTSYICCFGRRFDVMVRPGYARGVYYGKPVHHMEI